MRVERSRVHQRTLIAQLKFDIPEKNIFRAVGLLPGINGLIFISYFNNITIPGMSAEARLRYKTGFEPYLNNEVCDKVFCCSN